MEYFIGMRRDVQLCSVFLHTHHLSSYKNIGWLFSVSIWKDMRAFSKTLSIYFFHIPLTQKFSENLHMFPGYYRIKFVSLDLVRLQSLRSLSSLHALSSNLPGLLCCSIYSFFFFFHILLMSYLIQDCPSHLLF